MLTAAQLVGFGLVATTILVIIRQFSQASTGLIVRLAAMVVLLLAIMVPLGQVLGDLNRLAQLGHIRGLYLVLLLKVMGIAYLATVGSQVAQDAGEQALGTKIELAGKMLILVLAIPVLTAIVELLFKMMPS